MRTLTPGRRASIGSIGAGMAMLVFFALAPSAAAGANPTTFPGNPSCSDLGMAGFKINEQPSEKTYSGSGGLEIEITNVVVDDDPKMVTFDWSATVPDGDDAGDERDEFFIDVVLVKFANGGLRWDYAQPGMSSDTAWATQDSISHVSFCWNGPTGGTDGTTDSDTTGGETTTGDVAATTAGGGEVLGETVTRDSGTAPETLPATGSRDTSLAIAGVALVALGGTSLLLRNRLLRRGGTHFA